MAESSLSLRKEVAVFMGHLLVLKVTRTAFTTQPLLSELNVARALSVLSQNVIYHRQIVQPLFVVAAAAALHEGVKEVSVAAVRGQDGAAVLGHEVVLRQLGSRAHPAEGVGRLAGGRVARRAEPRGGTELVKTRHSLRH